MAIDNPGVEPTLITQNYAVKAVDSDYSIELPFGTLAGCLKLEVTVTDAEGQSPFVAEVVIHPEQNIVRFTDAPGVALAEMVSPWE